MRHFAFRCDGDHGGRGSVKKLICAVLIAGAVAGAAKAADLPTAKPAEAEPSKPSCFSSLWDYLKSSVKDCPLRYGPITL